MSVKDNFRALLKVLDLPLIALAALGLFLLTAYMVVVREGVMPSSRRRMVEVKKFLDQRAQRDSGDDIYFLGSSIVMEGIDCDIVDTKLPDNFDSFNLGLSFRMGAGPPQWLLLSPSLKAAHPRLIVLCTDLGGITALAKLPDDGLAIAGWWQFVPGRDFTGFREFLTDYEYDFLNRPSYRFLLSFRNFPFAALDRYIREEVRKDLRYEGYSTNFKNPWVRRKQIGYAAFLRWAEGKRRELDYLPDIIANERFVIQGLIDYYKPFGIQVGIILAPQHPEYIKSADPALLAERADNLRRLGERNQTFMIDCTTLLNADQFSDHVHPWAPGREVWSQVIGDSLAQFFSGVEPDRLTAASDSTHSEL